MKCSLHGTELKARCRRTPAEFREGPVLHRAQGSGSRGYVSTPPAWAAFPPRNGRRPHRGKRRHRGTAPRRSRPAERRGARVRPKRRKPGTSLIVCKRLLGSLRRGKNIDGFLAGKLVDPRRMFRRHKELVLEMERRGYRHASPLDEAECETLARRYGRTGTEIDAEANAAELARRCPECAKRLRRP